MQRQPEFVPMNGKPKALEGFALRVGGENPKFLMITHVFENCVYAMWVSAAEGARYARRPQRKTYQALEDLISKTGSCWGRIGLPPELRVRPEADRSEGYMLDAAWSLIRPLVWDSFTREENLSRARFTALIRERSRAKDVPFITLRRLVLRFYYFGGTDLALIPLLRGGRPAESIQSDVASDHLRPNSERKPKRRGRQPKLVESGKFRHNDYIVSEDDEKDMLDCFKSSLRGGPTTKTLVYEEYLKTKFKERHPEIYEEYAKGERIVPITFRQFDYRACNALLTEELLKNLRGYHRNERYSGSLYASGPGEVLEIDSTGGRLFLLSMSDPPILLEKPWIYLVIDRWSRYIPGIYITLKHPAYEELCYVLRIAFTSRERFEVLGVDITDKRWPPGRPPATLCPDRGSDFLHHNVPETVVQDLRIDVTPLPPYSPDAKAIVERFIRELKRRMAAFGLKGVYAEKPTDPETKHAAKKAKTVAIHSIVEAYRVLIEIVVAHNNRPHRALKRKRVLAQHGVKPTPQEAYFWGLKNITGLDQAPFTDEQYLQILRSVEKARIANGELIYKDHVYEPQNELAHELAAKSTKRSKSISIYVDKTFPNTVEVQVSRGKWAKFRISSGGEEEIAGITWDEEEALKLHGDVLYDEAEHNALRERVTGKNSTGANPQKRRNVKPTSTDKAQRDAAKQRDMLEVKSKAPVSTVWTCC